MQETKMNWQQRAKWLVRAKIAAVGLCFFLGWLSGAPAQALSPGQGRDQSQFHLQVPDQVGVGLPFQVHFSGAKHMEGVHLSWLGKDLQFFPPGNAHWASDVTILLGVDLETPPGTHQLTGFVVMPNGRQSFLHEIQIQARTFPEQRLRVNREMVSPDASLMPRIEQERRAARAALERVTPAKHWQEPFVRPVQGSVSSAFGLRRFLNDQPRAPHRGVDLRGAEGTPVRAFSNGKVVLTGDHYFAGRSVYIDHGLGVVTQYIHLSEITVQEGDQVVAGQTIGKIGATGRVTGPHLHFGLSILGMWVDPLPLLE
ncbi:M23 family metallopeptidase [Desulfonatronum thioautotrophicum]|uniref:M23 family metallopeptidase n=1 Tax=Desulfonatronum thioautotrophicum TaxID=617001 RepID=UPI00137919BE|nr:M23 family metallopeptidase [Desulfonatronum thioautotrophicum]